MRAQIVPKFDWLESTVKHKVGWATRSWKLCTRGLLRAMSVYASLSFPLLSHAARLLDQLISKFIPLGNGTQNTDKTVTEQHIVKDSIQHCTTKTASLQTGKVLPP